MMNLSHGNRLPVFLTILFVCSFGVSTALNVHQNSKLIERLDAMSAQLDSFETQLRQQETTQVMTTNWISGGQLRTLTTTWRQHDPNETFEAFLLRHKDEVRQAQTVFPKDPP